MRKSEVWPNETTERPEYVTPAEWRAYRAYVADVKRNHRLGEIALEALAEAEREP